MNGQPGLAGRAASAPVTYQPPSGTPASDQERTIAHLASTVRGALGHISRHMDAARAASSPASLAFNLEHAGNHVSEAVDHADKLIRALRAYCPAVGAELDQLSAASGHGPGLGSRSRDPGRPERGPGWADYDARSTARHGPDPLLSGVRSAARGREEPGP